MSHSCATTSRPRSSASDRVSQNTVLTQLGNNLLRILAQKASRARGWAPLSIPVNTISGATLFPQCRALALHNPKPEHRGVPPLPCPASTAPGATLFSPCRALTQQPSRPRCSASDRVLQNTGLTQEGTTNWGCFCKGHRAGAPFSFPVNTTGGATLFRKCRAVSKRKPFPLMLCLWL